MDYRIDKMQQDIIDIKNEQSQQKTDISSIKKDVRTLQTNDLLQDKEISNLQATLSAIQDDTRWIRRKITGAFITALITAVVAGIVGFAVTKIYGG